MRVWEAACCCGGVRASEVWIKFLRVGKLVFCMIVSIDADSVACAP